MFWRTRWRCRVKRFETWTRALTFTERNWPPQKSFSSRWDLHTVMYPKCCRRNLNSILHSSHLTSQELLNRSELETQKLELMTEVSSLKLKLTAVERDHRDTEVRSVHVKCATRGRDGGPPVSHLPYCGFVCLPAALADTQSLFQSQSRRLALILTLGSVWTGVRAHRRDSNPASAPAAVSWQSPPPPPRLPTAHLMEQIKKKNSTSFVHLQDMEYLEKHRVGSSDTFVSSTVKVLLKVG